MRYELAANLETSSAAILIIIIASFTGTHETAELTTRAEYIKVINILFFYDTHRVSTDLFQIAGCFINTS